LGILLITCIVTDAGFLSYFGRIDSTLELSQGILLDGADCTTPITETLVGYTGEQILVPHTLENRGDYPIWVCLNASEPDGIYVGIFNETMGTLTEKTILLPENIVTHFNLSYMSSLYLESGSYNVTVYFGICLKPVYNCTFLIGINNGTYDNPDESELIGTVAGNGKSITYPITVNSNNMFKSNATSINFSIKPIAPMGANVDDLATIYFSVDENQKFDGKFIFKESGGVYECKWLVNDEMNVMNYNGGHTMQIIDKAWVELCLVFDGAGTDTFGEEFDAIGDTLTIPVSFWNSDHSWTQTFDIVLVCVDGA